MWFIHFFLLPFKMKNMCNVFLLLNLRTIQKYNDIWKELLLVNKHNLKFNGKILY